MSDNEQKGEGLSVGFVVVTHNRKNDLRLCLQSISALQGNIDHVVVVDNNSNDGSADLVVSEFPLFKVLIQKENLGPGVARNIGVAALPVDICICIDDDASLVTPQTIRFVREAFASDKRIGGIGFSILDLQGNVDPKCIPRLDKADREEDYLCSYFVGCGCAFRRSTYLGIGGCWDKLFIGCEELDLAYRMLNQGYYFLKTAKIKVQHRESPQSRIIDRDVYLYGRNRTWIALRNLPWRYAVSTIAIWWTRSVYLGFRHGMPIAGLRAVWDGFIGGFSVLKVRQPLGASAVRFLRQHSGRLWY